MNKDSQLLNIGCKPLRVSGLQSAIEVFKIKNN